MSDEWVSLTWQGMDWLVAKGYEHLIPANIWDMVAHPDSFPECRLLKRSILRTSFLAPLNDSYGQTVFVKVHHRRHWKDDARSLVMPSRAFNEWKVLLHFRRLGLPTPIPLAYGEKRLHGVLQKSCIVTSAVLSAQPLFPTLSREFETVDPEKRFHLERIIISALSRLIARLHNQGVYFRDLHGGNILYRYDQHSGPELFLIDTDKARFSSRIRHRNRIDDLAQIYLSLFRGRTSFGARFLRDYCQETETPRLIWRDLLSRVSRAAQTLLKRHIKSRSKRCLKNSTAFGLRKEGLTTLYFRKEVPQDLISTAIQQARHVVACKAQEMSASSGAHTCLFSVSSPRGSKTSFCVTCHAFSWRQRLLSLIGPTPARRAWVNGHSLAVRDITTLQPLALLEEKGLLGIKSAYLMTKAKGDRKSAEQYFIGSLLSPTGGTLFLRRYRFIKQFAQSIRQLYQKRIFIPVLRAQEIFVEETTKDSWCFFFSSWNKITFNRRVSFYKQRKNLLQLYADLDTAIGDRDRLRFLFAFAHALPRNKRKEFVRRTVHDASLTNAAPIKRGYSGTS